MLSIVVPAYNEGEHIYENLMTIDKALKAFTSDYEIIAVNDGSKDNTGAEAARAAHDNPNIKDFGYEVNRGKGGAVSWGAVNSKGDIVGFIDADLDLSPDFIKMYFEEMNASGADIVIGSKMHKDSKLEYPLARKVFSLCYYIMLKVLFGLKCHDTQTGLKLYRGSLIREIAPLRRIDGYAFDIIRVDKVERRNLDVVEENERRSTTVEGTDLSADTDNSIRTHLGRTDADIKTGSHTLKTTGDIRNRTAFESLLYIDRSDCTGKVFLLLRAISYDDDLVEELCIIAKDNSDAFICYNRLGSITNAGDFKGRAGIRCYRESSLGIGHRSVQRTLYDYTGTGNGPPLSVNNNSACANLLLLKSCFIR